MATVCSRLYLDFILKILHRQLHQIKLGVQFKFSKGYLVIVRNKQKLWVNRKTRNSFKPYVQYIQTYNDLSLYVIVINVVWQLEIAATTGLENGALEFFGIVKQGTKLLCHHITPGQMNGFVREVRQCITPPAAVAFAGATRTFAFLRISTAWMVHGIFEPAVGNSFYQQMISNKRAIEMTKFKSSYTL